MAKTPILRIMAATFVLAIACESASGEDGSLRVSPPSVLLTGPESSQQLLVSTRDTTDITRDVSYSTAAADIAIVSRNGRIIPRGEGTTELTIHFEALTTKVPVKVQHFNSPEPVSFRREVLPILSKAGCNAGGCHGKAEGQNGFKLSIFGFNAAADHDALVKQGRGRRVFLAAPERSLLLQKATAEIPHGGGMKLTPGGLWYQRIARWIREGAKLDYESAARITSIEVEPTHVQLTPNSSQQVRVTTIDAGGRQRCLTREAEFESNADTIAGVTKSGLITVSDVPGEAAILVRYRGQVTVCRVTIPRSTDRFSRPPENNFIDRAVWNKLGELGIEPSGHASDATFLRRVFVDTIGTLPTAQEVREFLHDESPDKRTRLIDCLLQRDEYADYWAMRWANILRVDKSIVAPQGAVAMTRWLRRQFSENRPYDEFARKILAARGNTKAEGPASFYLVHKDEQMLSRAVSQIFLGVRIECAQCHHHPHEKWSQHDYYALAGFFSGVARTKSTTGDIKLKLRPGADLKHPRSGQLVPTAGLGSEPATLENVFDRREPLADWMTSPDNDFFARMLANRLWSHYFGRGLVEPIDDMRTTNPASNEPLLEALTQHLIDVKFDIKAFTRTLLNSRVYQLQSQPTESNRADEQNFSHASWKAVPAEVLLDEICQATGASESFNGWPTGYRAIQVWDNRMPSYFFRVFGRPQRVSVCECERGSDPSMAQALLLMNAPETFQKIRHRDGAVVQLARSDCSSREIVEELYLATLSRFPSEEESVLMLQAFNDPRTTRREAAEDILWTLLNTKEFIYNH